MIGMFSFRLLKAVAAIVSLVLILWTIGFPNINIVGAASITSVSDILSDTEPGVAANHTISFTTSSGVNNGETVTIDFSDGPFSGTSSVTFSDIDVQDGVTDLSVAANCLGSEEVGVSFSGELLTIEFCSGDGASIAALGTTTIEIGTNASGGINQLINPPTPDSYAILIGGTQADSGSTLVVMLETIEVSASVDTIFTFTVTGVAGGQTVNGQTTTGSTTATAIAFGVLEPDVASTSAQELSVVTNASQGYVVTVEQDSEFISSNLAIIDSFIDGSYEDTPTTWQAPTPVLGDLATYGHWGLTSDDATTTRTTEFSANTWVAASTTPTVVMSHTGPTDGTVTGEGITRVGYRVEISSLQEASSNYSTSLIYIATPIF